MIGLERTFRFFFQWHKAKGSGAFFGGIFIVLLGWPIIGMCVELYGFVVLFSGFFPVAVNFLRRIPVIGTILNMPPIGTVSPIIYLTLVHIDLLSKTHMFNIAFIDLMLLFIHFIYHHILQINLFSVSGQFSGGPVQTNDLETIVVRSYDGVLISKFVGVFNCDLIP